MSRAEPLRLPLESGSVSGLLSRPDPVAPVRPLGVILAHGAGAGMEHPLLAQTAAGLARGGWPVLRFQFPYREQGRKAPDRPPVLAAAWRGAARCAARYFPEGGRFVAAGKSMGGRVAAQLAAAGELDAAGLCFLGYPLHPPGRPAQLRDAHLYEVQVPMLFVAGTRDPLSDLELLRGVVGRLGARATLEVVTGGDHSLLVRKRDGVPQQAVYDGVVATAAAWLDGCFGA